MIRTDFNWNQSTFNGFSFLNLKEIYLWDMISIDINLLLLAFPFKLQRNLLIRKKLLKSICFQFMWIYFQLIFLFKPQINLLMRKKANWNQFTFNSFESTFNWFSFWISKKMHQKFLYHPNNYIIEDLGHLWGTSLKKRFGCCFLIRVIRV